MDNHQFGGFNDCSRFIDLKHYFSPTRLAARSGD
jgi:hypothetical protein